MNNQSDEKVFQGPKDPGEARGGNVFRLVPRADRDGEPAGRRGANLRGAPQSRSEGPFWDGDDDDPCPTAA